MTRLFRFFLTGLQRRLFFATTLALLLVSGLIAWSLERAFYANLLENQEQQLILKAYALVAAADWQNDRLWLPETHSDNSLNELSSPSWAYVLDGKNGEVVWRSRSSAVRVIGFEQAPPSVTAGTALFVRDDARSSFSLFFKVFWAFDEHERPFVFVVEEDQASVLDRLSAYREDLGFFLSLSALMLLFIQVAALFWSLRPLRQMSHELEQVKQGESSLLGSDYPVELQNLADSINSLIEYEGGQRERYRNAMSDLAHSLKNPVAIIQNALNRAAADNGGSEFEDIAEQSQRINQIVSYQLGRANSSGHKPFSQPVLMMSVCRKVVDAMTKVYESKGLSIDTDIDPAASFSGDEGDLMELLGNLLDNACKYGNECVRLSIGMENRALFLKIEDDGPGLRKEQMAILLKRGERADTSLPGQGIGLAVVYDIVKSYGGEILFAKSGLGGLCVALKFPNC